ncbi:hypothetical protein LOD99_14127 [Oopsacas minuta]|uniref:Gustatory receptor n=1 Tax=Oopsacas minuta TaxID=111878 RepID=A0AAV7KHB9_9METZ|nr:hypothetical protein LOD99_14127 [Oopsacas minuta]
MFTFSESDLIQRIVELTGYSNLLVFTLLNLCWLIYCIRECRNNIKLYNYFKRKPLLHPINRDIQYLSLQKRLYNLKTHIVKYLLAIVGLGLEIGAILWIGIWSAYISVNLNPNFDPLATIELEYPYCSIQYTMKKLYYHPFFIIMYSFEYAISFTQFTFLSILTRYLAARYMNHTFKRTLIKYIIWLSVQLLIVSVCSTLYTFILSFLLFPLLAVINWLVVLRDSLILTRVLQSNLRELKFHSNNKVLYREQLQAYKFYRFFQITLLFSLFLLIVVIFLLNLRYIFEMTVGLCLLNLIYGINYDLTIQVASSVEFVLKNYTAIADSFIILPYSLSASLPVFCLTFV